MPFSVICTSFLSHQALPERTHSRPMSVSRSLDHMVCRKAIRLQLKVCPSKLQRLTPVHANDSKNSNGSSETKSESDSADRDHPRPAHAYIPPSEAGPSKSSGIWSELTTLPRSQKLSSRDSRDCHPSQGLPYFPLNLLQH